MTDENKNTLPDDEYQFPKDEYVSSGEAKHDPEVNDVNASADTKNAPLIIKIKNFLQKLPPIKNKRILIVVIAVIALFLLFHFLNKKAEPPVVVQPVAVTPVAQPNNDDQMMGSLKEFTSRTESQIRDLQSQLSDMQNNLLQSQTENQSLQKSVADLTAQMQTLSAQLDAALSKVHAPTGKRIVFHLRAVLPDRAWITSNTGETVSVTVGDHVKQYGTIQMIDVRRGLVTTSSGRKIEYGPNDY